MNRFSSSRISVPVGYLKDDATEYWGVTVSHFSIQYELEVVGYEIKDIKILYKQRNYEDFRTKARKFLQQRREFLKRAAAGANPTQILIQCINGLVFIDHKLPEYDADLRHFDEDLLMEVMEQYHPSNAAEAAIHAYQKHTSKSNIYKVRSFEEAASQKISDAVSLMEESVRCARQALLSSPKNKSRGANKHLQYLQFHGAVLKMRSYEIALQHDKAIEACKEAERITRDPEAPAPLFPGYIWSQEDLDNYPHLIEASRAWFERNFRLAVIEYDSWMNKVQQDKKRWRYRNIDVRRNLSALLACLERSCDGCELCREALERLKKSASDSFLGSAGRHLAAKGLALSELGKLAEGLLDPVISEMNSYIPVQSYRPGLIGRIQDSGFLVDVPSYFALLHAEVKKLAQVEYKAESLREFVFRRLKEFLQVSCEYEEGRVAVMTGETTADTADVSPSQLAERIAAARRFRKGNRDRGASEWDSVSRALIRNQSSDDYTILLNTYESVLGKVAGIFPTIVRLFNKRQIGSDYFAVAQTLNGEEFNVESQFPLIEDFVYVPPRFRYNAADLKLMHHDRSLCIPSSVIRGIYALQNVPLWEGGWWELQHEHFETISLEYKQQVPRRLAKHLVAFTNTSGGWIILGIYDAKVADPQICIRGLTMQEAAEGQDRVATAGLQDVVPCIIPASFFRAYPHGKLVLLCRISVSSITHRVDGRIYVRAGTASVPVSELQWNDILRSRAKHASS